MNAVLATAVIVWGQDPSKSSFQHRFLKVTNANLGGNAFADSLRQKQCSGENKSNCGGNDRSWNPLIKGVLARHFFASFYIALNKGPRKPRKYVGSPQGVI